MAHAYSFTLPLCSMVLHGSPTDEVLRIHIIGTVIIIIIMIYSHGSTFLYLFLVLFSGRFATSLLSVAFICRSV